MIQFIWNKEVYLYETLELFGLSLEDEMKIWGDYLDMY